MEENGRKRAQVIQEWYWCLRYYPAVLVALGFSAASQYRGCLRNETLGEGLSSIAAIFSQTRTKIIRVAAILTEGFNVHWSNDQHLSLEHWTWNLLNSNDCSLTSLLFSSPHFSCPGDHGLTQSVIAGFAPKLVTTGRSAMRTGSVICLCRLINKTHF